MGEDLECLCQIMRTVGPRLDHEKAKVTASAFNGFHKAYTSGEDIYGFEVLKPECM